MSAPEEQEPPARPRIDPAGFSADEAARLGTVLDWFAQMQSRHFSGFLPALAEAGCALSRAEDDAPYFAAFASYSYSSGGFLNTISMTPAALARERDLFSTFAHEGVHALQNAHCAAFHALPQNPRTGIMLCPRDYIYLRELCERDAYAKGCLADMALEGWRRKTGGPETPFKELANGVMHLAFALQSGGSLENALAAAGEKILAARRLAIGSAAMEEDEDIRAPDGSICYKDRYNRQALVDHATLTQIRADDLAEGRLVFVRLEPEDIIALGGAFGPNPFTDENGALRAGLETPTPLHPANEELVQVLNHMLGIEDEDALPSFGQALAARGIDRDAFLWAARLPPLPPDSAVKPLAPGPKPA